MLMQKIREDIIKFGKKLDESGLTKGTGGNLSVFDRETGLMAITPSGIDFYEIEPEDIVLMDLEGNVVNGHRIPSSEWEMHLLQYKTEMMQLFMHTTYITVLAVLREPLIASHYMIAVAGKDVRCAKYATYGSHELAINATEAMKDRKAVILANHGILAGSSDLLNALI